MNNTTDKLLLLLWKNWVLQKRRRRKLMIDILIPFFIGAFLLYVRYSAKTYKSDTDTVFKPFQTTYIPLHPSLYSGDAIKRTILDVLHNATYDNELPKSGINKYGSTRKDNSKLNKILTETKLNTKWTVAWSPNNLDINEIMTSACKKINVLGVPVKDSKTLENVMTNSYLFPQPRNVILAGVVFPDDIVNITEIPIDLKVKIRFPGESRFGKESLTGMIPRNWLTGLIFPMIQIAGPREIDDTGGTPGYYREGFLGIQSAVSSSLLEYHLRNETNLPNLDIKLNNYPYSNYVSDPLLFVLQNILPFLIVLSFLFSVNTTVEKITTEKETKMKVIMNVMGLSNSVRWISWFIYSFAFFCILLSILVIAFKAPLVSGRSVFPHSDWSCLFLFLACFAFAAVTFCFLVSTIFAKASVASIVAGMSWFLTFVPFYVIQQKYAEISTLTKCVFSLFLNTGMGIGFHIIIMFEGTGKGIQWDNLASRATPDDNMTVLHILFIFIFDGIVHLCLALYIENIFPGEYGSPLPWYYPFQRSYWFPGGKSSGIEDDKFSVNEIDYPMEEEPKNLTAGIRIRKLRKVYDKAENAAVENLTLNTYEGEITVLMGFNGAGKTTTLSILTGIFSPTSGTALVAGYDIKSNITEVRRNLGYCPQYNILFDDLNVEEHVEFFGRLKGLTKEEIKKETDKYINLLNLNDKRRTLAKHLSGGMKRKLSVSLALCGKTKVLLFDEPTAGMDPRARRSLWDLLISEKKGRSILMTTHHIDEADILGDRIAIMSKGKLNCYGTSFFLKKRFCCGYRLIIVKKENCNKKKIDEIIESHIPEISNSHEVGMELFYRLPEEYSHKFETLFQEIETKKEELKIISFGVSPTSLEDVFMRIASEVNNENKEITKPEDILVSPPKEANAFNENRTEKILDNHKVAGNQLLLNQISAMFYKYAKLFLQSWKSYVVIILIAISGLLNAVLTIRVNNKLFDLPPRVLDLQDFPNGIVAVQAGRYCSGFCKEYLHDYTTKMKIKKMEIVNLNSSFEMNQYLIGECENNVESYRTKHILGTRFDGNTEKVEITSWFNGIPYHTPAIALSAVYNTIFSTHVEFNASTTFINEPLPYRENTKINIQGSGLGNGFQISIFVGFAYVFVASAFVTFPIQEREVKAKLLQFVSGINSITFWTTAFIWDLIKSAGPNIALLVTMAVVEEEGFKEPEEIGYCAVAVFSFFISALPLTYLGSLVLKKSALGFVLTTFFHIVTGIYSLILVIILQIPILDLMDVSDTLDWIFSIFPLYSMNRAIQNVNTMSTRLKMCKPVYENFCVNDTSFVNPCCKEPKQCPGSVCLPWTESIWDWETPGFGRYISFLFITGIIYFLILLVFENGILKFKSTVKINSAVIDSETDIKDSDVVAEREKVRALTEGGKRSHNFLIDGLTKKFKKHVAVNNLYLSVTEGECFGLLGANGAGKTTTFRMLTGDEYPSSGNAYVKGLSLRSDMKKIHKNIGYCPQFDALFDDLTGREHLRLYSGIRGIPAGEITQVSVSLARELLFEQYLDKKVKEYSGGNKRKLSTALALIGNPPIVYLDEPTAGIDPVAKRHLWNVISKLRREGTTIILTSHSMEECEALCTRLSIMVKGEFKCLGTTQYLKNKYCQGYSFAVKVKRQNQQLNNGDVRTLENEENDGSNYSRIIKVKNFVLENFRGATLLEEHDDLLVYRIPSSNLSWSKIFGTIESVKDKLHIEDYSLGQTTLEQIVLMFTGTSDTETDQ